MMGSRGSTAEAQAGALIALADPKLARILAGDETCAEHWWDLAGYAWLAARD
jgi:hypothetical protein